MISKVKFVTEKNKLDYEAVKLAALTLRSINHDIRKDILKLLEHNKSMKVTDIYLNLKMQQSETSINLAILRKSGIVSTNRKGKEVYYSLNLSRIEHVVSFVDKWASL